MPQPPTTVQDAAIAARLASFIERALPAGEVHVRFHAGVARLRGSVTTASTREAIADLIRGHDYVESVVNEIAVSSDTPLARDSIRAARRRPADRR